MNYRYSNIDRQNLGWFQNDFSKSTLLAIKITRGSIRGLENFRVDFTYPITAIAGRNGSGKTTVLALAACAFHGFRDGYRLPHRNQPYYTFKDFFIQTEDEVPLSGMLINYLILHNNWATSSTNPMRARAAWQRRIKRPGGRWNNYDRRVRRPVVYLGIDRIVPHAEKSVSRSYQRRFVSIEEQGWETTVSSIVGRILGHEYSNFEYRQHSRYRLPFVRTGPASYSGFNMGAGEDALFGLISTIIDCPDGTLLVIDEIELGLHAEAQLRLIDELKSICERKHIQIICTTHSPEILESLPIEGRIFLERLGQSVEVIPGISSKYAFGKLIGRANPELCILVEDNVAMEIVQNCLTPEQRTRTQILPIGSTTAVIRHLAVRYKENRSQECCAFLDGDASAAQNDWVRQFLHALEGDLDEQEARNWIGARLHYLAGNSWPERWIIETTSEATFTRLEREFSIDRPTIEQLFIQMRLADKHDEIYEGSSYLNINEKTLLYQLVMAALESSTSVRDRVVDIINVHIGNRS